MMEVSQKAYQTEQPQQEEHQPEHQNVEDAEFEEV